LHACRSTLEDPLRFKQDYAVIIFYKLFLNEKNLRKCTEFL
jgi:hypothetical protein